MKRFGALRQSRKIPVIAFSGVPMVMGLYGYGRLDRTGPTEKVRPSKLDHISECV